MGNNRKYTQFVKNNEITQKINFRATAVSFTEGKMPCEILNILISVIPQKTEIFVVVLIKFEYLVGVEDAPSVGLLRMTGYTLLCSNFYKS